MQTSWKSVFSRQWCVIAAVSVAMSWGAATISRADELFQLAWRGRTYAKGSNGQIAAKPFSEKNFINQVARDYDLDARGLVFVYRANKRDTAVVRASTGEFVANILQMEFSFTDVSNSTGTATVRQAFLFDEYHDSALGSAFGSERALRNTNGVLRSFSFRGTFQYSTPDTGTVYYGSFATGRRIADRTGN